MSDEQPHSDGPRKLEVLRHVRASLVMRARALASTSAERRAQCQAEAERLWAAAHDLARADEDGAEFERRVKAGGGSWFPKDGL